MKTGSAVPTHVIDLGAAQVVRASGPDAARFCNGMFTNNARDLAVGGVQRSAIVDDRGRVGGFLDVIREKANNFWIVQDGLDTAAFLERFEKFVVFDDVTLEDLSDRYHHVSVQGETAHEALEAAGLPVPSPGHAIFHGSAIVFPRRRSPAGGIDVLVPLGTPLPPGTVADAVTILQMRVLAGMPAFPADTGEKALPHELGLRETMLSFEKGCYLGQESINRIDVMGDVKRVLVGLRGSGAVPVPQSVLLGETVVGALTSPVSSVLSAVSSSGASGWIALGLVRKPNHADQTTLTLADGQAVTVVALPFTA